MIQRQCTLALGTNVTFSVTATGVPAPAYQWRRNGINLAGATQPSLLLTNVQPGQSGIYSVAVANSVGTVQSVEAELQVIIPPIEFADNFAAAGILYTTNGFGRGTNCGATKQAGEPSHGGRGTAPNSVWISWWAPANGIATFSTLGSSFDTVLAVYIGPGTSYATLTNVACNNDSSPGNTWSKVVFNVTSNTMYYMAVDGVGGASGTVKLNYQLGDELAVTNQVGISQMTINGTRSLRVVGHAAAGSVLESSEDLQHSSPVQTNASPSGLFARDEPLDQPHRYFRIRLAP